MENDYELLYLAKKYPEPYEELIYQKYQNLLYNNALKYSKNEELKDYLNEARVALYNSIKNYEDKGPYVSYLTSCVKNALKNYKRRTTTQKNNLHNEAISYDEFTTESETITLSSQNNPESIIESEEEYNLLKEKIINKLTWEEELVFILKEQNYKSNEISEIIDKKVQTVYTIVNRIKRKVSNILSNQNN